MTKSPLTSRPRTTSQEDEFIIVDRNSGNTNMNDVSNANMNNLSTTDLPTTPKLFTAPSASTSKGETTSTLSPRGHTLSTGPTASLRDMFDQLMGDPYDPTTNPQGMVNLAPAENYAMQPTVAEYVNSRAWSRKFTPDEVGYGEGPWSTLRLRSGLAKHMNKFFQPSEEIKEKNVLVTNGVTAACEALGFTIFDEGEGLLMGRPIYQSFPEDFGTRAGVVPVWASFPKGMDPFEPECVKAYEAAILKAKDEGTKVRALLLCNPHNPLGVCYPKETIVALMNLCSKYGLHLIADEIYAVSVYDESNGKFTSVLSFDCSEYIDPDFVHVMYGMSKDFAAGGLRVGCVYTRNEELWRAVSAISNFVWSGVGDATLATEILEDEEYTKVFFAKSRKTLGERSQLTKELLKEGGVECYGGASAGFFLWANFGDHLSATGKKGFEAEQELFEGFVKARVFIIPGSMLRSDEPGWFRIMFAQDETTIREGVKRIFKTVEELKTSRKKSVMWWR